MSQLIVRNLEPRVVARLKRRARTEGVSVEESHRRLLRSTLLTPETHSFKAYLTAMPAGGDDALFARQAARPRKVSLA